MGIGETLVLGLIAGATIVLGLPIGRLQRPRPTLRLFLTSLAIGVLLFLVWDVLSAAWEPIDTALADVHAHRGHLGAVLGYGALFCLGLGAGLLSLVAYDRALARRRRAGAPGEPVAAGVGAPAGSRPVGAALAVAVPDGAPRGSALRVTASPARRLAVMIATGIGLHNFAEGLAIGQSAARSEVALATMLVIGFGLHNATEGFGIVAPLAGDVDEAGVARRPSWGLLLGLGLIGGGPTLIGTAIGHGFTSDAVSVVFLTLAAGSILYVVVQLLGVTAKARRADIVCWGLLIGLLAGFLTDAIVTAAGA